MEEEQQEQPQELNKMHEATIKLQEATRKLEEANLRFEADRQIAEAERVERMTEGKAEISIPQKEETAKEYKDRILKEGWPQ